MIINHEQRWIYIGPPKTGSTTMHKELPKRFGGRYVNPEAQHDADIPEGCENYLILASVRDPYQRAVSLYWHYLRDVRRIRAIAQGINDRRSWNAMPFPAAEFPFDRFVEMIKDGVVAEMNPATKTFYTHTLTRWLEPAVRIDRLLRLESLDDNWAALPFVENHRGFPVHNAPGRQPWENHRTLFAVRTIEEWAAEDFDNYGYPRQTFAGPAWGGCVTGQEATQDRTPEPGTPVARRAAVEPT